MNPYTGILSALVAAVLFGATTPLAKLALSSAHPLIVAGLLYLGSGPDWPFGARSSQFPAKGAAKLRSHEPIFRGSRGPS
jgi:hypothetical protein